MSTPTGFSKRYRGTTKVPQESQIDELRHAVVLVSGGLDSATVLAMASATGWTCHGLTVDYGQRHKAELEAARAVCEALGAASHRIVRVELGAFGGSALTEPHRTVPTGRDARAIEAGGIPETYVPARNTVMLSVALSLAEAIEADAIFCGVNAIDYSGYPDCRPDFVAAFQALANVATRRGVQGRPIQIKAPLIRMRKAEIIRTGLDLGVDYALTVSCYDPDGAGRACGRCDACTLRRAGFEAAGVADPTRYRP